MREKTLQLIKFFLGWPLALLALFFIGRFALSSSIFSSVETLQLNWYVLGLSVISFVIYFFLRAYFWKTLLKIEGISLSLKEITFPWGISELQRYIPGNIWSIVGRAVSFEKKGISKKLTTRSWITESEYVAVATVLLSFLSINFIVFGILPRLPLQHVLVFASQGIFYALVLLFLCNKKIQDKSLLPAWLRHVLPHFSLKNNSYLLLIMTISFIFFSLGTYFSIAAFTSLYPHDLTTFLGYFSFSFAVGYVTLLFPMGVGPREALMTYGLSKYISLADAAFGALFSRVILVLSEIFFLVLSYLWQQARGKWYSNVVEFCSRHKHILLVLLGIGLYCLYFITASILRYNNFYAGRFDLGNMDQTVWNTLHGRIFQLTNPDGTNIVSRLSIHADYILVLLSPFYLIWQDPRTLLIIQTLILSFGALFIFLLAKDILKEKWLAVILALGYLLNPALEYVNLYDFHAVALATTFFLAAYYFLQKGKSVWFIFFLVLAGVTKEEVWIVVAMMGLFAAFYNKKRFLGLGVATGAAVIFYLVFFKAIPLARNGPHFALSFYSEFGDSPTTIAKSLLLSPIKTIAIVFQPHKLVYLLQLFAPLGFLSLAAPLFLVFALPDFAINLLSNNSLFHQIYYQYTAVITPFLFIAAIYGVKKIEKKYSFSSSMILGYLIVTIILTTHLYGPLPISLTPSIDMFWKPQPYASEIDEFLSTIPHRYSIAATNNIGSHLSHRQKIYTIPTGIDQADFLVFLLNDKFAQPSLPAQIAMAQKLKTDKNYIEIFSKGDLDVFEKRSLYMRNIRFQVIDALPLPLLQAIHLPFLENSTKHTYY